MVFKKYDKGIKLVFQYYTLKVSATIDMIKRFQWKPNTPPYLTNPHSTICVESHKKNRKKYPSSHCMNLIWLILFYTGLRCSIIYVNTTQRRTNFTACLPKCAPQSGPIFSCYVTHTYLQVGFIYTRAWVFMHLNLVVCLMWWCRLERPSFCSSSLEDFRVKGFCALVCVCVWVSICKCTSTVTWSQKNLNTAQQMKMA